MSQAEFAAGYRVYLLDKNSKPGAVCRFGGLSHDALLPELLPHSMNSIVS